MMCNVWVLASQEADKQFDTIEMSQSEIEKVWKNINFRKTAVLRSELKGSLMSFDVSQQEEIVMGLDDNLIVILSDRGQIIDAYRFETSGIYRVMWNGGHLLIYTVRGSHLIEVSKDGNLIGMKKYDDSSFKNTTIANEWRNSWKKTTERYRYEARERVGFSGDVRTQLVQIDENGQQKMLYNIKSEKMAETIAGFIVGGLMMSCALLMVSDYHKISLKQLFRKRFE